MSLVMTAETEKRLLGVWRFLCWLDKARWCATNMTNELISIPGLVFERLRPEQKVLTHWLCYIADQQRPSRQVWEEGGAILAEVVAAYSKGLEPPLRLLEQFTEGSEGSNAAARLVLRGNSGTFALRFGAQLFSIASTLVGLEKYGRSLAQYIGKHWLFCDSGSLSGSAAHRIAFLLYLLTYRDIRRDIRKKLSSLRQVEFVQAVEERRKGVEKILDNEEVLRKEYERWFAHQRYHKRLWAALRDYVKPGSFFQPLFLAALKDTGRSDISEFLRSNEAEILGGLEVPGDVWNRRFFERVFGADVDPKFLRQWYETLPKDRKLPAAPYLEQFDVSYEYSPNMCERRSYATCILRRESRIRELCPALSEVAWQGKLCPVAAYVCRYRYPCDPSGCPVREEDGEDLCLNGCKLT
jgi:hypothetical protein